MEESTLEAISEDSLSPTEARSLQKQAGKLLAIRQVTQLNAGKKTAGVDGKKLRA